MNKELVLLVKVVHMYVRVARHQTQVFPSECEAVLDLRFS
jgi:hypothetical protein